MEGGPRADPFSLGFLSPGFLEGWAEKQLAQEETYNTILLSTSRALYQQ